MTTTHSPSTVAALTAYLEPLCHKHAAGSLITYEDLIKSKQAADTVLAKATNKDDIAAKVSKAHTKKQAPRKESSVDVLSRHREWLSLIDTLLQISSSFLHNVLSMLLFDLIETHSRFARQSTQGVPGRCQTSLGNLGPTRYRGRAYY